MQFLRGMGWFFALLFIVALLLMKPGERRPFVQESIGTISRGVEDGSRRVRLMVEEPTQDAGENTPTAAAFDGDTLEKDSASRIDINADHQPLALPYDLLDAIEKEISKKPDREIILLWKTMRGSRDRQQQLDLLEVITLKLEQDWWPVDGTLIRELDLILIIANK